MLLLPALPAGASTLATATNLSINSGLKAVPSGGSIPAGSVVTLTATVAAGSAPVSVGQVNFCDASVTYCTDIHLLGTAQIIQSGAGAGTAMVKVRPTIGDHSYKAVFIGTTNGNPAYAASTSGIITLTVTPAVTQNPAVTPTFTTITSEGSAGNYSLTASVGAGMNAPALPAPTGLVSFLDTTAGLSLGSASLGAGLGGLSFVIGSYSQPGRSSPALATGDFNGDGIADIAVTGFTRQGIVTVTVFLGNGDGTFIQAAKSFDIVSAGCTAAAVGDFNGDGRTDLAVVADRRLGTANILLGNGDGTFKQAQNSPITLGWQHELISGYSESIAVGDFNGDGIADLVATNQMDGSLSLLLGNGDGTFAQALNIPVTSGWVEPNGYSQSIAVGDFNGDGISDIAVAVYGAPPLRGGIAVLLAKGDGTFSLTFETRPVSSIAVGDFNGDGILDLVVLNDSRFAHTPGGGTDAGWAAILLGHGDGTFSSNWANQVGMFPEDLGVSDFDGDGNLDVMIMIRGYQSPDRQVRVLRGDGGGSFPWRWIDSNPVGRFACTVAIADFNGDGLADAAVIPDCNAGSAFDVILTQLTETATATLTGISPVGTGIHQVNASYGGDSNYVASTSATIGLTASQMTPTLTVMPSSSSITTVQPLFVMLTVSSGSGNPIPTGSVILTSGSYSSAATVLSGGSTTITISAGSLGLGSNTLSGTYTPDATSATLYTSSTQSATVVVTTVGSGRATVTVTPSAATVTDQQSNVVRVLVAGSSGQAKPTGTVTLASGSYSAQQVLAGGTASFTIPAGALRSGTNTLNATYWGDGTFASSSGTADVVVSPLVMTITSPSPVPAGTSVNETATVWASSTYSGTVSMTCTLTGYPAGAKNLPTCSLSPAIITVVSGGSGTTVLTVRSTAASNSAQMRSFHWPPWRRGGGGAVLACLLTAGLASRRRRLVSMLISLSIMVVAGMTIGCGRSSATSGSEALGTTAGSYTFTLLATDPSNPKVSTSTIVSITFQ